jgi:hypothetical protein
MTLMVNVKAEPLDAAKKTATPLYQGKSLPARNGYSAHLEVALSHALLPAFTPPRPESPESAQPLPTANDSANLLWGALAALVLTVLLVVPGVMACLGDPRSLHYLIRLGSTAGLFLVLAGLASLPYLFSRR